MRELSCWLLGYGLAGLLAWGGEPSVLTEARKNTPPAEGYSRERQKAEDAEREKAMEEMLRKPVPAYSREGWKLVWAEEFDGDKLNPGVWGYEKGFIRNQEPQYYTDRQENVCVKDGKLIITARKEKYPNPGFGVKAPDHLKWQQNLKDAEYTSASVITSKKRTFLFGRLEVRAQMPEGHGCWPAIWLMGDCINESGEKRMDWPACGEIDLLEIWCRDARHKGRVTSSFHAGILPKAYGSPHISIGGGELWECKPYDGFHTYTLDWDRDWLYCYYDGKCYGKLFLDKANWANGDNPFRHPLYLIINLALGGYGNSIDSTSVFPSCVKVDWIRYYQREDAPAPTEFEKALCRPDKTVDRAIHPGSPFLRKIR